MHYEPVIGLEVHVQLNTATKIFCSCATVFGEEPNSQTCPVCLGLPGVLPVLNREALIKAIRAGLALNCSISQYSKFDRKNYFYPDLPKAYQISQYDKPICGKGYIEIDTDGATRRIGVNRVHLEEDAGKNMHSDDSANRVSFVDFNRCGVPLIEIVSEPDIATPEEAYQYLLKLKSIMKYLDVSDCNMEEGSLRCDVNVSIRPKGTTTLGEKVEVKNLNSFKAVKLSLEHEIARQKELLDDGERIHQETRLWDADRNETFSMRSKEEAHDYRYFPDPDLAPVIVDASFIAEIKDAMPELPDVKIRRFIEEYALPRYDAGVLCAVRQIAEYFESVVREGAPAKKASNWIMGELLAGIEDPERIGECRITPTRLAKLISLIDNATISGKIAKMVFADMLESGEDPERIVESRGLKQVTDVSAIESVVDSVIEKNPASVADYRSGKEKALGFLVGQVMKLSQGKANPQIVNELLVKKLTR